MYDLDINIYLGYLLILYDGMTYSKYPFSMCNYSLGATRDGVGNNTCNGSAQYLMSNSLMFGTAAYYANAHTFSSCSIQEFWAYLQVLNRYVNILLYFLWSFGVSNKYCYL